MSKYKKKYIDMKSKYINLKYGGKSLNIKNIQDSVMEINDSSPHAIINCDITQLELDAIEKLTIRFNTYNGYGNMKSMNDSLRSFFYNMSNNDDKVSDIMTQLVLRIGNIFLYGINQESAWITIRTSNPNPSFDIPRWHMDGKYFKEANNVPKLKLVVSLKGPSTLLSTSSQPNIRDYIRTYRINEITTSYLELKKQLQTVILTK